MEGDGSGSDEIQSGGEGIGCGWEGGGGERTNLGNKG